MMGENWELLINLRKHPEHLIGKNRGLVFGSSEYYYVVDVMKNSYSSFLQETECEESIFPAVDLASGSAVYPVAFAQHFQKPEYAAALNWYASEWKGSGNDHQGPLDAETKAAIQFLCQEEAPLCGDANGNAVFVGDTVELAGLSQQQYNGLTGVVIEADSKSKDGEARFGVRLDDFDTHQCKKVSLKPQKLILRPDLMGACPPSAFDPRNPGDTAMTLQQGQEKAGDRNRILQKLLDNTRHVDILQPSTWDSVSELDGKCAVVTCINFLICCGWRDPDAWQDCLKLASKLLLPKGVFITFDKTSDGGYGDLPIMDSYCKDNDLGLVMAGGGKPISPRPGDKMQLLVWKKDVRMGEGFEEAQQQLQHVMMHGHD